MEHGLSPIEQVTKLEAARRQLRTAIRLFFEEKDSVSIQTLAGAVETILADLLAHRGEPHPFRDSDVIREERRAEFKQILNRPRNFFKHADSDPEETLEFRAAEVPYLLFECAHLYLKCTGRTLREGWAFLLWFGMNNPDVIGPGELSTAIDAMRRELPHIQNDKGFFLDVLARPEFFPGSD